MTAEERKSAGAYYTPDLVAKALVKWALRKAGDRLLDPSCGDGTFLKHHPFATGIERDESAAQRAKEAAPGARIEIGDFFDWSASVRDRFDCAAGNPPFIRYQRFSGSIRSRALSACSLLGAHFSALASSWAPFLVVTASHLRPGGRLAFVVPAEIGHATYSHPLLEYLASNFEYVQLIAIRSKIFHHLSEDCWLLYASGFGGRSDRIHFTRMQSFAFSESPPKPEIVIDLQDWRQWNFRLRPFLLSAEARSLYHEIARHPGSTRLSSICRIGIGYVSGDNEFFHLRPSLAASLKIPGAFLQPTVRNGKQLKNRSISRRAVAEWVKLDEPCLLLRIPKEVAPPPSVKRYLDTPRGNQARSGYKCRNRTPWWTVPDVCVPHAFLSYMSGDGPTLVSNLAGCACSNSVHAVRFLNGRQDRTIHRRWDHPLTRLSCELEGHPLGGGMLKLEPREAGNVLLAPPTPFSPREMKTINEAIATMRSWRHLASQIQSR